MHLIAVLQILTKAGVFSVPEWYNAGKVYIESEGAIPFSKCSKYRIDV
jgi:hypothetical protein